MNQTEGKGFGNLRHTPLCAKRHTHVGFSRKGYEKSSKP